MTPAGEHDAGEGTPPMRLRERFGGEQIASAFRAAQAKSRAHARNGRLAVDAARAEAVDDDGVGAGGRGGLGIIVHDPVRTVDADEAAAA